MLRYLCSTPVQPANQPGKRLMASVQIAVDRKLMVIDTFGTLDEDRWWDAEEYAKGNIVELSKEFVRQYYRETGYHKALYDAREKGEPEPDIPALPQEIIDRVSKLYVDMYERITGEKF